MKSSKAFEQFYKMELKDSVSALEVLRIKRYKNIECVIKQKYTHLQHSMYPILYMNCIIARF